MIMERPPLMRTEAAAMRTVILQDLPPVQAGLSAALRRAFDVPHDDIERQLNDSTRIETAYAVDAASFVFSESLPEPASISVFFVLPMLLLRRSRRCVP